MSTSVAVAPRSRPGLDLLRKASRHGLVIAGGAIVLVLAVTAVLGATLAPYDPVAMDFTARFAPPSWAHPFGTDDFGRDLFSRVLHGARSASRSPPSRSGSRARSASRSGSWPATWAAGWTNS